MRLKKKSQEPLAATPESDPVEGLFEEGVYASWYMGHRLPQEVARAQRHGRPLTVLAATPFLLPGESLTRQALKDATDAARLSSRETDLVGWGEDGRLLLVLIETPASEALVASARLADAMYQHSRGHGGQKWRVTVLEELGDFADLERLAITMRERLEREQRKPAA